MENSKTDIVLHIVFKNVLTKYHFMINVVNIYLPSKLRLEHT